MIEFTDKKPKNVTEKVENTQPNQPKNHRQKHVEFSML